MPMYTLTKRKVRVILDIECYDDLDIEELDWNDILHLEGDENVDTTIVDDDIDWWVCRSNNLDKTPCDFVREGLLSFCGWEFSSQTPHQVIDNEQHNSLHVSDT